MLVSYVFQQDFGDYSNGDVIQLDSDKAQALVDAGYLAEATEDDIAANQAENGGAAVDDSGTVTAALEKFQSNLENSLVKATEVALSKATRNTGRSFGPSVPAQVKEPLFKSWQDQIRVMYRAQYKDDVNAQNKLKAWRHESAVTKANLGLNETTSADGAVLTNPTFSDEIWKIPIEQVSLADLCEVRRAVSKTYTMRLNTMTSMSSGNLYGGVQIYDVAEGATLTASKPQYSTQDLNLQKKVGLTYFTRELLEDESYDLSSELSEMMATAFTLNINGDIISASGTYLEGILNTPSLITVSKESGQNTVSASTGPVLFANLRKMWGRLYNKVGAVFLVHPETETYLSGLAFTSGGTAPAWGLNYDPSQRFKMSIFGAPVVPCWNCSQVGTVGDIILFNPKSMTVVRTDFVVDSSSHIQYLSDQIAYRYSTRIAFKSPMRSALTGPTGTQTFSNFVVRESLGST